MLNIGLSESKRVSAASFPADPDNNSASKRVKANDADNSICSRNTYSDQDLGRLDGYESDESCPFHFFDNVSESQIELYRKDCLDALNEKRIHVAEDAFKLMVYLDDRDGVKAILAHPVAKTSAFQRGKHMGLLEGIERLNPQIVELMLSSGASPFANHGIGTVATALESNLRISQLNDYRDRFASIEKLLQKAMPESREDMKIAQNLSLVHVLDDTGGGRI